MTKITGNLLILDELYKYIPDTYHESDRYSNSILNLLNEYGRQFYDLKTKKLSIVMIGWVQYNVDDFTVTITPRRDEVYIENKLNELMIFNFLSKTSYSIRQLLNFMFLTFIKKNYLKILIKIN